MGLCTGTFVLAEAGLLDGRNATTHWAFCDELKRKGVRMAVEPWEFKPGMVLCYVAAPDGVSIELIQAQG